MASIINTGISALTAFKRQMETTGHNIANVNTEGYSRQRVQLETRNPQVSPAGYIGSGVEVASIHRAYDDFLAARVRDYTSSYEESSVFYDRALQIDNVFADASASMSDMMQQFFAAVDDVADDPTSIAARSVMISRGNQLAERFNTLDRWLDDMRRQLNQDLEHQVGEINSLAQSLADVNSRIGALNGSAGGIPNDILDERDRLVDQLSHYTSVSTLQQSDGSMNVFIGTGQALVVGGVANSLAVSSNVYDSEKKEIVLQQSGGLTVNVSSQITGGSLGGLLRFGGEVLDDSQAALGRVALGLADYFNGEHQTGMDLDGDLGGLFFGLDTPEVLGRQGNAAASTAAITITDPSQLTTHSYRLDRAGGAWSMTDLTTGAAVALSGAGTAASPLVAAPPADLGFSVVASAVNGDSFLLRPTRNGAEGFRVLVDNERDIAAADPIRSTAASANSGTGTMSPGALTSLVASPTKLATPLTLQFNTAANRFDIYSGNPPAGPAIGNVAYNPATDSGDTLTVSIGGLGDFSFEMTGTPANGDRFVLADNTGGVGDNRNARRLADLQTANLMIGGTATLANTYGALIADVGTSTQQAGNNASVQENLLAQAEAAKAEVSGVNLDEEAADLMRFQQAYQAAAQVINIANSLFDSLLAAVRR